MGFQGDKGVYVNELWRKHKHYSNVGAMLTHRLRRWPNVVPALG